MSIEKIKIQYLKYLNMSGSKENQESFLKFSLNMLEEKINVLENIHETQSTLYSDEFKEQAIVEKNKLCLESSVVNNLLKELF